jgi:uncharacterized protein YndB with AHSA1/START domain
VRQQVSVPAPPERAFAVFTAGMGRWWPRTHSIGTAPQADVVMEPRAGGRWYERGQDGSECEWGRVLQWEPPARLLLAWQIDGNWRYVPGLVTEVEVTFTPDGAGATRVLLEHRNIERFGEHAERLRAAFDSPGGWAGMLRLFAEASAGTG